jgi:glutamine synthetase
MASQVVAGLDGLERGLEPPPSADAPYETDARRLPPSLDDALDALLADAVLVEGMGRGFVDYLVHVKRAELARHAAEVGDWEHREYFDLF